MNREELIDQLSEWIDPSVIAEQLVEDMEEIAYFSKQLEFIQEINLLPYHELGRSKYSMLNREYPVNEMYQSDSTKLTKLKESIEKYSIKCIID